MNGKGHSMAGARDMVHVNLLGQSELLRLYAARHGMKVSVAVRTAISRMLEGEMGPGVEVDKAASPASEEGHGTDRVLLRLPSTVCARLASRAAAAGMSRSQYVMALMVGEGLPPAGKHEAMVAALTASTAGMATQWVDLRRFLRLLSEEASDELAPLLVELQALPGQLREHLVLASGVLAELEKSRRYRR